MMMLRSSKPCFVIAHPQNAITKIDPIGARKLSLDKPIDGKIVVNIVPSITEIPTPVKTYCIFILFEGLAFVYFFIRIIIPTIIVPIE